MLKELYQLIKDCIWAARYRKAVRKAKKMSSLFNMTYFVLLMDGKLKVVPKRTIKDLISRHRFRSGTTIQDIEKRALFVAK